ncbi:VanW family protein [Arthrobacter sp. MSA 4-2]|uniref:VanW family protein n=1 Tax=Arthrobacter sp. MSA 4-2 TaxID=2794349 RepID=UPI0018E8DCDB|nr:VanW family protein [Arthrobacter sp. MSA 4-2]MBJ2120557.1 VanW family protein [Arthrobacter sp. MSA 4-2]
MARKLFGEISPLTYRIAMERMIFLRHLRNFRQRTEIASTRSTESLPVTVYKHNSLIRRRLGNVETELQDNKAVSLGLTAPKIDGIVIAPGERFSFWSLAGRCSAKEGYKEGLTISNGKPTRGIGGGMCQFTNLLHWMVLHSPLTVVEHHHHNGLDLFPDYNRQIPWGTGTSIAFNYLDYQVENRTPYTFQFRTWTSEEYLSGELRADRELPMKFHIRERDAYFYEAGNEVYRHNKVYRIERDKRTGLEVSEELILENEGRVAYDRSLIRAEILPARPAGHAVAR